MKNKKIKQNAKADFFACWSSHLRWQISLCIRSFTRSSFVLDVSRTRKCFFFLSIDIVM